MKLLVVGSRNIEDFDLSPYIPKETKRNDTDFIFRNKILKLTGKHVMMRITNPKGRTIYGNFHNDDHTLQ